MCKAMNLLISFGTFLYATLSLCCCGSNSQYLSGSVRVDGGGG